MDVMNHQQAEREAELMQANREELVERIARAMHEDGTCSGYFGYPFYKRASITALPFPFFHYQVINQVVVRLHE